MQNLCQDCRKPIVPDDDAMICKKCGGRNSLKCANEFCVESVVVKGLCKKHYQRVYMRGYYRKFYAKSRLKRV